MKDVDKLIEKANSIQAEINELNNKHGDILKILIDKLHFKKSEYTMKDYKYTLNIWNKLIDSVDKFFIFKLLEKMRKQLNI